MSVKKTKEQFIKDARKVHGNKYNYDKVVYIDAHVDVIITCPITEHGKNGDFPQSPTSHLSGAGCKPCATEEVRLRTLHKRIQKLVKFLKDRCTDEVTLVEETYSNNITKAQFDCKTHGLFIDKPSVVKKRKHPCKDCNEELQGRLHRASSKDIEKKIKKLKGNFKVIYLAQDSSESSQLKCNIKDHPQFPLIYDALNRKVKEKRFACPRCGYLDSRPDAVETLKRINEGKRTKKQKEWEEECGLFHNYKYDYTDVVYIRAKDKVDIRCPIHGIQPQTPDQHRRNGCRSCADLDLKGVYSQKYFDDNPEMKTVDATIYYLEITLGKSKFYKVGVTVDRVSTRFSAANKYGFKFKTLKSKKTKLYEAWKIEDFLLNNHAVKHPFKIPLDKKKLRNARIGKSEAFSKPLSNKHLDVFK
tara:strand:- start:90 stop:1337 length:1248 start_codon:yes stop_codon:yes gene_type:complete